MEEAWERAVEAALEGQADDDPSSSSSPSPRTLTLDGAVKCLHGRLPPPSLLERFQNLEHLSIANVGVSSLEKFPRLRNLQRLILSDNRIAGGLEFLVEAGLDSLRDLDLSNNRIQFLDDLAPLARLRLVSLDLYECPVTRVKDYRSRVFGMIRSLKYLDKMDADENERPESDEEEEEDEEDEEEEEDPGSGEIDGEDRAGKQVNGVGSSNGGGIGIVDADEDEESDADEEETETGGRRVANGSAGHIANGFRVAAVAGGGEEDEEEEEDLEDEDDGEPGSTARLVSTEGEIDGHEQGEEDDENGEIGEEDEQRVEEERDSEEDVGEGDDEEEDFGGEYLVQPIVQPVAEAGGSDIDGCNEEEEDEDEVDDDNEESHPSNVVLHHPSSSSQPSKRKRGEEDGLGDDTVKDSRPSKHQ